LNEESRGSIPNLWLCGEHVNVPSRPREFWRSRLNLPVYRLADAARYADVSGSTLSNWHKVTNNPPILSRKDAGQALSYLQLIEFAVVAAARKAGVGLPAIRRARDYCSRKLNSKNPFAEYRFKTDGKDLWLDFAEIAGDQGRGKVLGASKHGQLGWSDIIGRLREFEYGRSFGLATKWYVAGRESHIIIDPRVSFGAPSIDGVPTRLIKQRSDAGEPESYIAEDYEIPLPHIIEALRFEGSTSSAGTWRKN
jgi:uncharacterized protein (DUF433 family)